MKYSVTLPVGLIVVLTVMSDSTIRHRQIMTICFVQSPSQEGRQTDIQASRQTNHE